jgi:hypothetical protein
MTDPVGSGAHHQRLRSEPTTPDQLRWNPLPAPDRSTDGPTSGTGGLLLELSRGGKQPLHPSNGEQRAFLEDAIR